jgi:hypothetical protein
MRARRAGANALGTMNTGANDPRLRWYPQSWRARYADELVALLDEEYGDTPPVKVRLSLITGGLRQRARQSGLSGDSAPAADGVRAGALVVLAAWTAFVIAGASFAKFSEHFDEALPHNTGAHRVPDLAFTVVQTAAGVASILVCAGALVALPAFVRFLRAGGWASIRTHFLRALACTMFTVVATVPLLIWAHHLSTHQRNDGLHLYGTWFLIWAVLVALTLSLWTVAAVAATKRIELPTTILTAEAVLAATIAGAMMIIVGATAVWWATMAEHAPTFLSASPGGAPGSPWDLWFIATVVLMVVAIGAATAGVVREVRVWTRMRST